MVFLRSSFSYGFLMFPRHPCQKEALIPISVAMVPIPMVSYTFPMIFPWFSHGLPRASCPKTSFGSYSYGYGPYSYGRPMLLLWPSDGFSMVPIAPRPISCSGSYSYHYGQYSYGFPMVFLRFLQHPSQKVVSIRIPMAMDPIPSVFP